MPLLDWQAIKASKIVFIMVILLKNNFMNNQQLNEDQLCEKLMLEQFRYWNYSRVTNSGVSLNAIKENVDELRSAISKSLSNR